MSKVDPQWMKPHQVHVSQCREAKARACAGCEFLALSTTSQPDNHSAQVRTLLNDAL